MDNRITLDLIKKHKQMVQTDVFRGSTLAIRKILCMGLPNLKRR